MTDYESMLGLFSQLEEPMFLRSSATELSNIQPSTTISLNNVIMQKAREYLCFAWFVSFL